MKRQVFLDCNGLGIVGNNELNSYLDYCSHRREYRNGEEERESHLVDRENYIQYVCLEKGLVLCLLHLAI